MNFAFTEEQQELRAMARAFLADHSGSEQVRAAMASELGYDPQVWKRIGSELGWPALLVPEEHGGLGLGWVELVALQETAGEALLCSPFFASVCLGGNALLLAASDEQKRAWLPALAAGELRATLALCAPGRGWEPDAVGATARRVAGPGSDWRLDGVARYVPDGHCADLVVLAARREGTRGSEGISLFALEPDTPGLERRALPTLDQTRRLAEIRLTDARTPAASLLGEEAAAGPALERALERAAVALAAEQVGGAQRCLDLAVDYARERVQFGRPIGSFQAIQHKCADVMVAVESARSGVYYAACVAADDGEELPAVSSLAKAVASEAYFRAAAECLQIHGGVGFTWEYDVHLHLKRARAGESLLGEPAWHRERVARHMGL